MKTTLRHIGAWAPLTISALFALGACHAGDGPSAGSETHFLRICQSDAQCGQALSCVCGACTKTCTDVSECGDDVSVGVCTSVGSRPLLQACGVEIEATCEVPCENEADCSEVGDLAICDRGLCRTPPNGCEHERYSSEDFILLGDNFLANSGRITELVEQHLVELGTFSAGDEFRDYSSEIVTPFGGGSDLTDQFEESKSEGPARVVIMDAAGPDALLDCDTSQGLCPNLELAVAGTATLLSDMEGAGVEQVILFFYPRPDEAALEEKFNLLADALEVECAEAPMTCHFLRLAPLYEERRDELLTGMGLFPTEAGSEVAAGAIVSLMHEQCIVP